MPSPRSPLDELAAGLRGAPQPLVQWAGVDALFRAWVGDPGFRGELKDHLRRLTGSGREIGTDRSKETTTHDAWCLLDEPADEFSLWLHLYKPQRDWRAGYANTVHNHRYHFSTTILAGSYLHQRFDVRLDPDGRQVCDARLAETLIRRAGSDEVMLSEQFHRIPRAEDGTITFLVKSAPVRPWSVSYDPRAGTSWQHTSRRERLTELAEHLR